MHNEQEVAARVQIIFRVYRTIDSRSFGYLNITHLHFQMNSRSKYQHIRQQNRKVLQAIMEAEQAKSPNAKIEALKIALREQDKEIAALKSANKELETENNDLMIENFGYGNNNEQLSLVNTRLQIDVNSLETRNRRLRSDFAQSQEALNQATVAQMELQVKHEAAHQKYLAEKDARKQAENVNLELRDSYLNKIKTMRNQYQDLQSRYDELELKVKHQCWVCEYVDCAIAFVLTSTVLVAFHIDFLTNKLDRVLEPTMTESETMTRKRMIRMSSTQTTVKPTAMILTWIRITITIIIAIPVMQLVQFKQST